MDENINWQEIMTIWILTAIGVRSYSVKNLVRTSCGNKEWLAGS